MEDLTLSFLLIDSDINDFKIESNLIKFYNTLTLFKKKFKKCLIIIDSNNKNKDPINKDIDFILQFLVNKKLIQNLEDITVHFINWNSEFTKINKDISKIYKKTEVDLNIRNFYKNNVAHLYSFLKCETQFMFHIDIPRKQRVKYISNDATQNFTDKSMEDLKKYKDVYAYCLMQKNDYYVHQFADDSIYQIYFDNKANISLQCTIFDMNKVKKNLKNWCPVICRFQFENQLTNQMRTFNLKAGTFLPNSVFPLKIDYD